MIRFCRKLSANRNLIKNLVLRDLKHRYVGSMGGFLWSVIHPIVLLVSYTFVFTVIFKNRLGPEYGTNHFSIFLFCGILPWLLFQDTVMRNCSVITDNAPLITKTIIPAEILPISITLSNLIHHLIGLGLLLGALVLFYDIHSVCALAAAVPADAVDVRAGPGVDCCGSARILARYNPGAADHDVSLVLVHARLLPDRERAGKPAISFPAESGSDHCDGIPQFSS